MYTNILFSYKYPHVGLLLSHRIPPQVADWRMFASLLEDIREIKYSGWTKSSNNSSNGKKCIRMNLLQVAVQD